MISSSSESMKSISLSASIACIKAFQLRREIIDVSQMQRVCFLDNCCPGLSGKQLDNWNNSVLPNKLSLLISDTSHAFLGAIHKDASDIAATYSDQRTTVVSIDKASQWELCKKSWVKWTIGLISWEQHPNSNISSRANNALSKPSSFSGSRWFISREAFINGPYFPSTMKKNEGNPYTLTVSSEGGKWWRGLLRRKD